MTFNTIRLKNVEEELKRLNDNIEAVMAHFDIHKIDLNLKDQVVVEYTDEIKDFEREIGDKLGLDAERLAELQNIMK